MSDSKWYSESVSRFYMSRRVSDPNNPLGITEGAELLDGRYRIYRLLARGGFSTVFLAHDALRRHDVALKIALTPDCDPDIARAALQHELDMYMKIAPDPHVLQVFDLHFVPWQDAGLFLLSMEFAEMSLRDWLIQYHDDYGTRLAQGPGLFAQICQAISPVHNSGIVHLDVKPENLLFVGGVVKIADFGASRHVYAIEKRSRILTSFRPALVLTPSYASPELFTAVDPRDIQPKADVFSIGIIMYEIFSRACLPPHCSSYEELHTRCMELMPDPPVGLLANAVRVMARCLEET